MKKVSMDFLSKKEATDMAHACLSFLFSSLLNCSNTIPKIIYRAIAQ